MKNVTMKRVGSKLIVEMDLAEQSQPSSSGKTLIVASTKGNADVPGCSGVKIGINMYGYEGYSIGT